ncbi:MAG: hypothetical protein DMF88_18405 [Acidobacteria bacterium]|nr:MAG: hypothetical protein DMF88_18405 [Acidobacteriota bacterium]
MILRGGQWSSTACSACYDLDTSSITMLRGDVMYYKENWLGSHEFQTGFLAMPRSIYTKNVHYLNDGFIVEERRMADPNNAAAGTVPFARQYVLGDLNLDQSKGRDKDIGFYGQDSWKAGRLTTTLGLRVDLVRRFDVLRRDLREVSPAVDGHAQSRAVLRRQRRAGAAQHLRPELGWHLRDRDHYAAGGDVDLEPAVRPGSPSTELR